MSSQLRAAWRLSYESNVAYQIYNKTKCQTIVPCKNLMFVGCWKCAVLEKRQSVKSSNLYERSNQEQCSLEYQGCVRVQYTQIYISDLGTVHNGLSTGRGGFNLHGWDLSWRYVDYVICVGHVSQVHCTSHATTCSNVFDQIPTGHPQATAEARYPIHQFASFFVHRHDVQYQNRILASVSCRIFEQRNDSSSSTTKCCLLRKNIHGPFLDIRGCNRERVQIYGPLSSGKHGGSIAITADRALYIHQYESKPGWERKIQTNDIGSFLTDMSSQNTAIVAIDNPAPAMLIYTITNDIPEFFVRCFDPVWPPKHFVKRDDRNVQDFRKLCAQGTLTETS